MLRHNVLLNLSRHKIQIGFSLKSPVQIVLVRVLVLRLHSLLMYFLPHLFGDADHFFLESSLSKLSYINDRIINSYDRFWIEKFRFKDRNFDFCGKVSIICILHWNLIRKLFIINIHFHTFINLILIVINGEDKKITRTLVSLSSSIIACEKFTDRFHFDWLLQKVEHLSK